MLGVVVWSNLVRKQAVIWCEDHAALAYLAGAENLLEPGTWPEPGDLVELEDEVVGELRCARRVRPLTDERLPLLPELLRRREGDSGSSPRHLVVVSNGPGPAAAVVEKPVRQARSRLEVAVG